MPQPCKLREKGRGGKNPPITRSAQDRGHRGRPNQPSNSREIGPRLRSLGGARQPGPVCDTVRNVWSSKHENQNSRPNPAQKSPAEEVRSAWASRFDQSSDNLN